MSTAVLVILSHAPYGDQRCREGLDIALTAAAFEQPVTLLLTHDAVNLLRKPQQPDALGQKNLASLMAALPMYDIERIYADKEACADVGLNNTNCAHAEPLDAQAIATLIREHHWVVRL